MDIMLGIIGGGLGRRGNFLGLGRLRKALEVSRG